MRETATAPAEVLTLAEIYDRFKSEWVLLEDPEVDEHLEIVRGKVVCHSKDRDEVYKVAIDGKVRRSATLYTGKLPPNAAILL